MSSNPLDQIKEQMGEIDDLKGTLEYINKGTSDYTYRMMLWFYSVTNRWFGIETDPKDKEQIEALSKRVLKDSYSKEGVQHTDFYDANSKEWLLSGCIWLEDLGDYTYQFRAEFTTCYGEKSYPRNMIKVSISEKE